MEAMDIMCGVVYREKQIRGKVILLAIVIHLLLAPTAPGFTEEVASRTKIKNLKILTSFPPDFFTPFIEAFKKKNPPFELQILNKKTTAAIAEIQRGNDRNFDIFWSSSPDAFAVLKEAGKLKLTDYIPRYPPLSKEKLFTGDADGYFFNFAISGVGYMWNEKVLEELGIAPPVNWFDLAHTRFYGHVAMSSPSRSGTNHLIVESLLQSFGWERGWRFLLQVSGNFETITARSFSVSDGVENGRFGAGMVIDFLALSKMDQQQRIGFSYGHPVFLIPAGIAVLNKAGNPHDAVAFIDFILSREGQEMLLLPSIGRLPVLESFLFTQEKRFHPLMKIIKEGSTLPYDTELSRSRYPLINNLFDQLITYRLLERRRVWKRLLQLENTYGSEKVEKLELRRKFLDLVCEVPITEQQSRDRGINDIFSPSSSVRNREKKRRILEDWEKYVTIRLETADNMITEADQELAAARYNLSEN